MDPLNVLPEEGCGTSANGVFNLQSSLSFKFNKDKKKTREQIKALNSLRSADTAPSTHSKQRSSVLVDYSKPPLAASNNSNGSSTRRDMRRCRSTGCFTSASATTAPSPPRMSVTHQIDHVLSNLEDPWSCSSSSLSFPEFVADNKGSTEADPKSSSIRTSSAHSTTEKNKEDSLSGISFHVRKSLGRTSSHNGSFAKECQDEVEALSSYDTLRKSVRNMMQQQQQAQQVERQTVQKEEVMDDKSTISTGSNSSSESSDSFGEEDHSRNSLNISSLHHNVDETDKTKDTSRRRIGRASTLPNPTAASAAAASNNTVPDRRMQLARMKSHANRSQSVRHLTTTSAHVKSTPSRSMMMMGNKLSSTGAVNESLHQSLNMSRSRRNLMMDVMKDDSVTDNTNKSQSSGPSAAAVLAAARPRPSLLTANQPGATASSSRPNLLSGRKAMSCRDLFGKQQSSMHNSFSRSSSISRSKRNLMADVEE